MRRLWRCVNVLARGKFSHPSVTAGGSAIVAARLVVCVCAAQCGLVASNRRTTVLCFQHVHVMSSLRCWSWRSGRRRRYSRSRDPDYVTSRFAFETRMQALYLTLQTVAQILWDTGRSTLCTACAKRSAGKSAVGAPRSAPFCQRRDHPIRLLWTTVP